MSSSKKNKWLIAGGALLLLYFLMGRAEGFLGDLFRKKGLGEGGEFPYPYPDYSQWFRQGALILDPAPGGVEDSYSEQGAGGTPQGDTSGDTSGTVQYVPVDRVTTTTTELGGFPDLGTAMDYIFGIWVGTEIGKKIYDKFRKQPPKPPEGKEPYTPPYIEPEKPKPIETPEPSPEIVKRITGGDFPIKEPEPITIEDLFKGPELIGLPTPDEVKEPGEEISGGIVPTPHRTKKLQPKPEPHPVKKPEGRVEPRPPLERLERLPGEYEHPVSAPEPFPGEVKRILEGGLGKAESKPASFVESLRKSIPYLGKVPMVGELGEPTRTPVEGPSPLEVAGAAGTAGGIAAIGSKIIESAKKIPVPAGILDIPGPQVFEPAMKALGVKIHDLSPIPVAASKEVQPQPRSRLKEGELHRQGHHHKRRV
jgi:hypothetical protein